VDFIMNYIRTQHGLFWRYLFVSHYHYLFSHTVTFIYVIQQEWEHDHW